MIRRPQQLLILRILSMNFILPTIIYSSLSHHLSQVMAIFYSGIPPSLDAIIYIVTEKRLDAINMVVLTGTIIGCAFALATQDPAMLLLKDSIVTAVFGFGFLISLCFKENMCWWYNKKFNGASPEDAERLNRQWANKEIRRGTVIMTWVWGIGYIVEAIMRVVLQYLISIEPMVYISISAPVVFTAAMATWSYFFVKLLFRKYKSKEEPVLLGGGEIDTTSLNFHLDAPSQSSPPSEHHDQVAISVPPAAATGGRGE